MNQKENMQVSLLKTFNSVQSRIDSILRIEKLDIKDISDLERYVGMQHKILEALHALKSISAK